MSSSGLTEHHIALIEESFAAVAPQGAALVARFYQRLFQQYPEVKPLFAGVRQHEQQKKLLNSLVVTVNSLRKPDELQAVLEQLGVRHNDYGTKPEHYPAVGEVLLKTLAEYASDVWGSEVEEAWTVAYGAISQTMIDAAAVAAKA